MKFPLLSTLVLALLPADAAGLAFGLPSPVEFLTKAVREATQIEILSDVGLPTDTKNMPIGKRISNFVQGSKQTNIDVLDFVLKPEFDELHKAAFPLTGEEKPLSKTSDEPRSRAMRALFTYGINDVIKVDKNEPDPAEGYLYFGNRDFKKILPMLCQTNPFYASALTVSEDGEHLELVSFNGEDELVEEPLYLSLMREMTDDSHRINAKFDKSMNVVEITKLGESGDAVVVPEEEWDYYSSGIIYNLFYYASVIHANIHILHYLMCACIVMSTRDTNESMEKWADIYDDNIAIKYAEVAALLFESTVAGEPFNPTGEGKKLVSGPDGFGATPKLMYKVKRMLLLWGSLKTTEDFTKKFLQKGAYMTAESDEAAESILQEAGILTEFNKHRDNVPKFADELTAAMKEEHLDAFEKTEKKIESFMAACGRNVSSINSVSSWLQLMSMTGLVHGSTLSYTRLILVPEIIRWRKIADPNWTEDDRSLMSGGFGTLQGMTLDRHVFTSSIQHGWKWDTEDIADKVKSVLEDYDSKAEALKAAYEVELEKRDDLREYGWILTDHCTDGYDGKQHTITTYI